MTMDNDALKLPSIRLHRALGSVTKMGAHGFRGTLVGFLEVILNTLSGR